MGTSIAQEYYKIQDYWQKADSNSDWRLAVWIINFHDVDIVDKFLQIEASPLGRFEDIFFHFETEYKGDNEKYEKDLFNEYLSWFDESHVEDGNILNALRNDGLLLSNYQPDRQLEPIAENLWRELLRFKSCIKDLEKVHFCLYISQGRTDGLDMTGWYKDILKRSIPDGIRLVTIDYREKRKIKLSSSSDVCTIEPELKMEEALNNEIDKGSYQSNTVGVEGRYRKQIRLVLDCSLKKDLSKLEKEIQALLDLAREMNSIQTMIGTYMIISLAWFYARENEKCEEYADRSVDESEEYLVKNNDLALEIYPSWKGAMMLKAAMLMYKKQRRDAISVYERLAEEATRRADAFYIMESYRLAGHLYYELSEFDRAFEYNLLALAGGSYLELNVRRQSTFLQAANLALYLCSQTRRSDDLEIMEAQLKDWLGDDWESLVRTEDMDKSHIRRKASIFS
jgi:hypothetical protein